MIKLLSFILVLALVISTIPAIALADEPPPGPEGSGKASYLIGEGAEQSQPDVPPTDPDESSEPESSEPSEDPEDSEDEEEPSQPEEPSEKEASEPELELQPEPELAISATEPMHQLASGAMEVSGITYSDVYIGYYVIENPAHLAAIDEAGRKGNYLLAGDIALEGEWIPLCSEEEPFAGVLDGRGHTISGILVNESDAPAGLFTSLGSGASIKNLALSGEVTGGHQAGMLAGITDYGQIRIEHCSSSGRVTGSEYVGGLIGDALGNGVYIGNCNNSADVLATARLAGGIAGCTHDIMFVMCSNTGSIEAGEIAGGISGNLQVPYESAVSGEGSKNSISDMMMCHNDGSVTAGRMAGGLVGIVRRGSVSRSYNTGSISGREHVGGLVGLLDFGESVTQCYNRGPVTGVQYVSGLVGSQTENVNYPTGGAPGFVLLCYFDDTLASLGPNWGISTYSSKGISPDELTREETFERWDFDTIWTMGADGPVLRDEIPEFPDITEINITRLPDKTRYLIGEPLDSTGIEVTAVYSNGTTRLLDRAEYWVGDNLITEDLAPYRGTQAVFVRYHYGLWIWYDTLYVSVEGDAIHSLTIASRPAKTTYTVGETLDLTGLSLSLKTYDGELIPVTQYTATPAHGTVLTSSGYNNIRLSTEYGGVTYNGNLTVLVKTDDLTGITIASPPNKTLYHLGEPLDLTGLVVTAQFGSGSRQVTDCTTSPAAGTAITSKGTRSIYVYYTSGGVTKSARFYITSINPDEVTEVKVTRLPDKLVYAKGDPQDLTGMEVTATFKDGRSEVVTGYSVNGPSILNTVGTGKFTISYLSGGVSKSDSFTYEVDGALPASLSVERGSSRSSFTEGEKLDTTSLVVTVTYGDGTKQQVTDYTCNPGENAILEYTGSLVYVTVTYTERGTERSAKYYVHVNKRTPITLEIDPPAKTQYLVGEAFDPTGMVVRVGFSGGLKEATTNYTLSRGPEQVFEQDGNRSVTVTYTENGKSVLASVTVYVQAKEMSSLMVRSRPTRTTYVKGEKLDLTGLKVEARYPNSSQLVEGYTTSIKDCAVLSKAGTQTITISYTQYGITKTAQFSVIIKNTKLSSITASPGAKTGYQVGDALDLSNLVVTAAYQDGTSAAVKHYTTSLADGALLTKTGTQTVIVTYAVDKTTKTASFPIMVGANAVEKALGSIAVPAKPTKTSYTVGDAFDTKGMKVTAFYTDGTSAQVTSYTTNPAQGTLLTQTGSRTVTVSYTESGVTKTASFTVEVEPIYPTVIHITTPANKTTYNLGETLDLTGLVVTATYSDGSKKVVTDYTVNPAEGFTFTRAGTQTVSITYIEGIYRVSASYYTTGVDNTPVKTLDSIAITTPPTKTQYTVGECFLTSGMKVTATYADGSREELESGYKTSLAAGTQLQETGDHAITVSYTLNGVTKTDSFTIAVEEAQKPQALLSSIAVTTLPKKTEYVTGQSFDGAGMVVTATYSDGSKAAVTGYTVTPNPVTGNGNTSLTVRYTENGITKTASFSVKVKKK